IGRVLRGRSSRLWAARCVPRSYGLPAGTDETAGGRQLLARLRLERTKGGRMSDQTPTVVLVHGAFADASSWNGVVELLQAKGVKVTAPANPLRGIAIDSAYVAGVLGEIPGPVLAVGHSYGGAVITNAATGVENVL